MRKVILLFSFAFLMQQPAYAQEMADLESEKPPFKEHVMIGDVHEDSFLHHLRTPEELEKTEELRRKLKRDKERQRLESTKKKFKKGRTQ